MAFQASIMSPFLVFTENIFPRGFPSTFAIIFSPPLFKRIAVININGKSVGKIVLNQSKSPSAAPVKTISGETSIARKRKTVRLPALRKPIFFNKFLLDEHFKII